MIKMFEDDDYLGQYDINDIVKKYSVAYAECEQLKDANKGLGKLLQEEIFRCEKLRAEIQRIIDNGCGNHNCKFKAPIGQGTNGPCSCMFQIRKTLEKIE